MKWKAFSFQVSVLISIPKLVTGNIDLSKCEKILGDKELIQLVSENMYSKQKNCHKN